MLKTKAVFIFLLALASCFLITGCQQKNKEETQEQLHPSSEFDQIPLIQNLTAKISEKPNDPELHFARAKAYMELGNHINAMKDINEAIRLDSTAGEYYIELAEIHFSKQEYTRAITALETGCKNDPDNIDLMLELARYQLYAGERQKSIQLLDDVLRKNVSNAEAYFLKGMIFKEIGDTAKAISNFQTSVEQNPKYYQSYMQLGLLLTKKKDTLALDYLNNALKLDPSSYEARYAIAMYHQEMNENEKAIELYNQMIMDFPQEKDAYYNIGYIHFQMDSVDKASRDFDRAIAVAPDYADAYYMRGLCAEVKKDFNNARHYYHQALKLNPEHRLALAGLQRTETG